MPSRAFRRLLTGPFRSLPEQATPARVVETSQKNFERNPEDHTIAIGLFTGMSTAWHGPSYPAATAGCSATGK